MDLKEIRDGIILEAVSEQLMSPTLLRPSNDTRRRPENIMIDAAKKTLDRGKEYHKSVINAFDRLPKKFKTKPFFEVTLWYYNKVLNERFKEFSKGKNYSTLRPQLLKMIKG